jgi:hypothetical protein
MSRKQDYALPDMYELTLSGYAEQLSELAEDYLADSCLPSQVSVTISGGHDSNGQVFGNTGNEVTWEKYGDCSLFIERPQASFNQV